MNIIILGSTGSIGTQTLDIIRNNPDMHVRALSAHKNSLLLEKQVREFRPELVCMSCESAAADLKVRIADLPTKVLSGEHGLCDVASYPLGDTVVTAIVGIAGLLPTIAALESGKKIALSNKETLVTAGHIVTRLAKKHGCEILPVDSEHSAIFQCMQSAAQKPDRIILTASGGPFFGRTRSSLEKVTPSEALKHPNWDMGAKVTLDSATLANKGLEVIEAHWLFDMDFDDIDVVVHRQSVIHSMVVYADGAVLAQMGVPDMHLPIQYALTYPNRRGIKSNRLDFSRYNNLSFDKPDTDTFPALRLAYEAGRAGGILPAVFNGADEAATALYLKGKIGFLQISEVIENAMANAPQIQNPTIDDILSADSFAKSFSV